MKTKTLLARFLPYYKKYRGLVAFDLVCALLTTACDIALPLIMRAITNAGLGGGAGLGIRAALSLSGLYLALRAIDAAAQYFMTSVGHKTGSMIESDMREGLFEHLQRLSFSFFDNMKAGQIMSRITSDLFDVTEFAHHCPEEFLIAFVKIIASFAILSSISLSLSLAVFSFLPALALATAFFNRRYRKIRKKAREQLGELNASVEDSLLGVRVVKAFSGEATEIEKFSKGNRRFLDLRSDAYTYMARFNTITRIFDGLMYVAVLLGGTLFMANGKIGAGDLVAYLLYVTTLLASVRRIVEFMEQFQLGLTGIERFLEIMDAPPEITDREGAVPLQADRGEIVFDRVGFSYGEGEAEVLSNISLHVEPGAKIALVGPSGSGKTTLCSLLPRFYDVTSGAILIDGQDVRDVSVASLRSKIGVVQQDVYLFAGTVYENIAYGKPGATPEEAIEAAKRAGAHAFIEKLPNGYDTYVGERGVRLSGGQKQRISIARVFLKNPPILIMDEATSSLDAESERIVQNSLESLASGRTTFTIAHRLSTIRSAAAILVLTENGIEEQGTHEELMKKRGIYSRLYSMHEGGDGRQGLVS